MDHAYGSAYVAAGKSWPHRALYQYLKPVGFRHVVSDRQTLWEGFGSMITYPPSVRGNVSERVGEN